MYTVATALFPLVTLQMFDLFKPAILVLCVTHPYIQWVLISVSPLFTFLNVKLNTTCSF